MKNRKESMTGASSKPDITHVRRPLLVYTARGCQYGDDKYERANYLRGPFTASAVREYLRATISHLTATLDALELHQAQDPNLEDAAGVRAALMDPDNEPGKDFPASMLPHLSHGCSSLNMAITTAVVGGLIDSDPGTPWRVESDHSDHGRRAGLRRVRPRR